MENRAMPSSEGWKQPQQVFDAKGWAVVDPVDEKIGKVDEVFVGSDNQPRYLGVKMGLFGLKMTLIPVQLVNEIDPTQKIVRISITKDVIKEGPVFDRDHAFTTEDEIAIWDYYGMGQPTYVVTEVYVWPLAS
jgi:hypothetical protein